VVDDDVEVDLQAEAVRALDEGREVGLRAEVAIDRGEVPDPVAVVGRARALHGLLTVGRRDPHSREPEILHTLQAAARIGAAAGEPAEIAAVVPPGVGGVEAGHAADAGEATPIVRRIAVRVAVGHHEVDPLGRERRPHRRLRQRRQHGTSRRRRCRARTRVRSGAYRNRRDSGDCDSAS
jgi:hypothetical protein